MGTVNYKTSDIITIGLKPYEVWDFEHDPDFMKDAEYRCIENGCSIFNWIEGTINEYTEDDYNRAQETIDKYSFDFFTVSIEPGHYEGFSIDIRNNLPGEFYNDEEREEALNDADQLRELLITLVNDVCLVQVYPGWVTTYIDPAHSLTNVKKAMREVIAEINDTPNEERSESE